MFPYIIMWTIFNCASIRGHQISNISDTCIELLDEFSYTISNFTYCSLNHARPVKLCEQCSNHYADIIQTYKQLLQTSINGTACIDNYINLDRLEIVHSVHSNVHELWRRAKCDVCLTYGNDSSQPVPSKIMKHFNHLYNIFSNCTQKYNNTNETVLCKHCISDYVNLNKYYFSVGDITQGISLCMDIVDLMNDTQANWSKTCCKYRVRSEFIYILTTVFMFVVPIAFYILVKLFVDIKRPSLSHQNRFAESINTPSTSYRRESS